MKPRRGHAIALGTSAALAALLALSLVAGRALVAPGGDGPEASPFVLESQPPESVALYHYAAEHEQVLAKVACYCGCGSSLGHTSLLDCFIRPGGGWDEHASYCVVCTDEAKDVRRLLSEGKDAGEIARWIDAKYAQFGPPTSAREGT